MTGVKITNGQAASTHAWHKMVGDQRLVDETGTVTCTIEAGQWRIVYEPPNALPVLEVQL